ncbi:MAG: hypothetical protein EOO01_08255, partial [Chitinophagaceae bacterium]
MLAVAVASIATNVGITQGSEVFKYIAVGCQLYILYKSFWCISRLKSFLNTPKAVFFILLVALIPLLRILFYALSAFNFKTFTDALVIQGSYYQLVFPAIALALLTRGRLAAYVLYRYSLIALPVGIALTIYTLFASTESNILIGHMTLTNCLIPVGLLALYPAKKARMALGWIAIGLILFLSSKIWSRSYTLIGAYLAIIALIAAFKTGQQRVGLSIICIALVGYFGGLFSFFSDTSVVQEASLQDKYQFDTLLNSLSRFFSDGDIIKLFFWEGNSRSEVLVDAFRGFS